MANARTKGVRIGRLKTRDSDLIRKLRASGMTYRQIAIISKCLAGAVSAEIRAMKAEMIKVQHVSAEIAVHAPNKELQSEAFNHQEIEMSFEELKLELDYAS